MSQVWQQSCTWRHWGGWLLQDPENIPGRIHLNRLLIYPLTRLEEIFMIFMSGVRNIYIYILLLSDMKMHHRIKKVTAYIVKLTNRSTMNSAEYFNAHLGQNIQQSLDEFHDSYSTGESHLPPGHPIDLWPIGRKSQQSFVGHNVTKWYQMWPMKNHPRSHHPPLKSLNR